MTLEPENVELGNFNILFYESPQPMWIVDMISLRFLDVNQAAIKMYGYSKDEFLSKSVHNLRPNGIVEELAVFDLTGDETYTFETEHVYKGGSAGKVEVTTLPILYRKQKSRLSYLKDITSKKKKERLSDYLKKSGEELSLVRDTRDALKKISELVVPAFADWFTINVVRGEDVELFFVKHSDPEYVKWAGDYRKRKPITIEDKGVTGHILRTGESLLIPEITEDILKQSGSDEEQLEVIRSLNLRSSIIVPMKMGDEILGTVNFISATEGKVFDEIDLDFAKDFATRIAFSLENARLYDETIKEKKQAELNLANLKNLIQQAPVAICILSGKDYIIDIANEKMFELWGLDLHFLGHPVFKGLPHLEASFRPLLNSVMESGETLRFEEIPIEFFRNGMPATSFVNFSYQPVRDAEGTITGVLAVAIDVTAQVQSRKKIEEAEEEAQAMNEELTAINEELSATNEQLIAANNSMHESEEQFRNLANAIPQLAWIADGEGWIFWYNNRWYEFTGTNFEQMQGWGWEKVHHPDHRDHVVAFVKEAWKRAEPFELTFPLLSKEGDWHWFLTRAVPIFSSGGKLVRWFGTNTDVTEQREALELNKQLLKEMEYERNRFEAIVKQMPGSVVIGEAPSGKLIFANEKLLEVWGHPLIESQNIEEYIEWIGFHPDGRRYEGHEWPLARAIQKGETVTNEDIDIIRGDDKPATLRLSAAPIKDSTGNVIAGVVISQDVTEFKAAIKSRDEFLSIASHELKTPLTTLTASIQMLMRVSQKDPASPLLSQLIETSAKSTGKLAGLVQELLNLSNIESGQLKLKKTRFRLMELVNECRIHVTLSGTHEIFVIGDPEIEVEADRSRVDQVILNFLNNAVKYSPQANEVRLAVEREGNKAKISVIDKGIGIEEEKIPYVFDRYYRVDSSGVQFAGLGLGLYICAEIVKIHGGEIGVVSEPGKGSTFWFTLPLF